MSAGYIGTPEGLKIPDGVREVIGQRPNRLSERCNEVLTTAFIVGRKFDFKLLCSLSGEETEDRVLDALEEALGARVIEEPPATMGRYQFNHALIQETLAQELSTTRRARLHARIGQALEASFGDDSESHAAELSHHFAGAELILGFSKLVRYSLLAGDQALASHAYEDAIPHFKRALAARGISLSGKEMASDEEAAALLFGLARAKSATTSQYQVLEAFANLSREFEYYADVGNVTRAVELAEFPIAVPSYLIPGNTELMVRALALVPQDSHEAGRLLSRYGEIIGSTESDYEGAQQALGRAIAIARREGDVSLEARSLTYAASVSGQHLRLQESVDYGQRAIELTTDGSYSWSELTSRFWTATSLLCMGNLDAARPDALLLGNLNLLPLTWSKMELL